MNREILFRGKRVDNGEWVEGTYFQGNEWNLIITAMRSTDFMHEYTTMEAYEVIPETVGQYTGLCDKNGTKIFEGDIILWGDRTARTEGTAINVVAEFRSGCFGISDGKHFHEFWNYIARKWDDSKITDDMWGELPIEKYFRACFEVIGNRWDNPELLEVSK
jgi:uncharacterized phage protein (TIGR01671 family)